jgi:hypothetical protein
MKQQYLPADSEFYFLNFTPMYVLQWVISHRTRYFYWLKMSTIIAKRFVHVLVHTDFYEARPTK